MIKGKNQRQVRTPRNNRDHIGSGRQRPIKGDKMIRTGFLLMAVLILLFISEDAFSLPSFDSKNVGFYPVSNNVSFYRNIDDLGRDRGRTLQIVSINTIKILTRFDFEYCGDFNWDMSCFKYDYYMELGIVKPVVANFSVNYQRVISKFENKPVNQLGIRLTF